MSEMISIALKVNGSEQAAVEPRRSLVDFLRHDLGLVGTHRDPTDEKIRVGLGGNLCMCAGYLKCAVGRSVRNMFGGIATTFGAIQNSVKIATLTIAQQAIAAQSYMVRLVTACLMIFFCLAATPGAASLQKIVVAYVSPSDSMIIPGIARDSGIFAKYGFDADVVLVTGSPRVVQSLIGGSFDYAIPGGTPLLRARVQGADTVILSTITDYSTQRVVVHPRSGIQKIEQLKGSKVGVTQYGSEGDAFLRMVLQRAGLKPDTDVQIIQTGGSGLTVTALAAGKLDAAAMGGSVTSVLASRKTGATTLVTAEELKVLAPSGVLATTRRKIGRSRDEVRRFIRAYVEGIHFLKNNREAAIRIMQKYMGGLPIDIVSQLYDSAREEYPPLPVVREEAIQAVLDRDPDPKARNLKPKDVIDMSFLRELDEKGFVTALYQKR